MNRFSLLCFGFMILLAGCDDKPTTDRGFIAVNTTDKTCFVIENYVSHDGNYDLGDSDHIFIIPSENYVIANYHSPNERKTITADLKIDINTCVVLNKFNGE